MKYCNLRVFSHYSIFKSIITPKDLIEYCVKHSIPAVGLCEEMSLASFVQFNKYALKHGIKPILGCLLKIEKYGLIPFFIKDQHGFDFISYVLSQYNIKKSNFISIEELKNQNGLICILGGENSIFYSNESNADIITEAISVFQKIFSPSDLFIEIQPKNNYNLLLQKSIDLNIPIVCTNPVNFLYPEEHEAFYVFKCIGSNSRYSNDDFISDDAKNMYIHNENTISDLFSLKLEEGLSNSVIIAKKCNFFQTKHKAMLPSYSLINEDELLENKTLNGLRQRLLKIKSTEHNIYEERLQYELKILKNKGFSGYFLITADFVQKAHDLKIPTGLGRGSGAGSLVAYSLSITNVDPIKFGLIFERFLNPERDSTPDFDIDFCPRRRHEVVDYLKEKYGIFNISQICTFGTLQAKAAIKDLCRVFFISYFNADRISKLIPLDQVHQVTLQDAINLVPQLQQISKQLEYKKVFEMSLRLEGLIKNTSKHAAGILISKDPVWKLCPMFIDETNEQVTQLDLQDIEYVGGVKFDFLGLRTLTVIDECFKKVKNIYNIDLTIDNIPLDDIETFKFIKTGNLDGVFQFDGPGIRDMLVLLGADNIEDLIVMNALYRPGPIKKIPSYINRKQKKEEITYPHESTKPILKKTLGIIVYQEQVMDIARICAGYTYGEADSLRRAMGKKNKEEMEKNKMKFIAGAQERKISKKIAEHLFDLINEFSGYGFNKSHAAPYAIIAYVCSYLKAHYPREFICSFLNEEISNTEKIIRFIKNAQQMGIKILKPCVNISGANFNIEGTNIRYGLSSLKNLGESNIEMIIHNKSQRDYRDVYDFVTKNIEILNKKSWKSLVKSGSIDTFGISRATLIDSLDSLKKGEKLHIVKEWNHFDKCENEKEVFGFFINSYIEPLLPTLQQMNYRNYISFMQNKLSSAWIFIEFNKVKIKRGKDNSFYAFAEVISEESLFYIAIFGDVLAKHTNLIKEGSSAMVKIQYNNNRIIAKEFTTIDDLLKDEHNLSISINNKSEIHILKKIIDESPTGNTNIIIVHKNNNTIEKTDVEKKIQDSINFRNILWNNSL